MIEVSSSVTVDASPERVWAVLTEFDRYAEWNPFIRSLSGEARPGEVLSAEIALSERRRVRTRPRIDDVVRPTLLSWSAAFPWRVHGVHVFTITPVSGSRADFAQRTIFTGPLVGLLAGRLQRSVGRGLRAMNVALASRVAGAVD